MGPGGVPVTVGTDPVGCCAITGSVPGSKTPKNVSPNMATTQIKVLVLRNIPTSLSQNERCGQTQRSNYDQDHDENSSGTRRARRGSIRILRDFQWRRRGKSWHAGLRRLDNERRRQCWVNGSRNKRSGSWGRFCNLKFAARNASQMRHRSSPLRLDRPQTRFGSIHVQARRPRLAQHHPAVTVQ